MATIKPEALAAQLARGLAPVYVLHGDEPLLVSEAGDAIRAAARARGHVEREVLVTHQHFKWDAFRLATGNLSLFGDAKLIDLRIPNAKPGREGAELLPQYAAAPNPAVLLLITLPQIDWQTRKTAWFGALEASAVSVEANAPPLAQLPAWIAGRLAQRGLRASAEALEFIAGLVEGNLLAAHQEIEKLSLLHPEGELTLEQARDAVLDVARYDVDGLRTALLAGNAARCARLLDALRAEGSPLPLVLWSVAAEVRGVAVARAAIDGGQAPAAALRADRIFDQARIRALEAAAQRVGLRQARTLLARCARIDRMVKGIATGDPWDELLQVALALRRRENREARNSESDRLHA